MKETRSETMAARLRKAMIMAGKKAVDVSNDLNIPKSSLSEYISGRAERMSSERIYKLAQYFGVTEAWLMGFDVPMQRDRRDLPTEKPASYPTIPLLGKVAAGMPIYADGNIEGYVDAPEPWADSGEYFALTIKGHSMEPLINDGDIVIVHEQQTADSGDIVIATVNGDDGVCKKLLRSGKMTMLLSLNAAYDPIDVTGREDFTIWGKVVEGRKRF